ncbi:MAG: hypothetical protein WC722_17735 [Rhodospirillales bacterium]|jgi:hypothetical protein
MRAQSLSLPFAQPLPFMRPHIAGFEPGQRVEFPDPKSKTLTRRGRVVVTLPHFDEVVIYADDGATVAIAPGRVRKIT